MYSSHQLKATISPIAFTCDQDGETGPEPFHQYSIKIPRRGGPKQGGGRGQGAGISGGKKFAFIHLQTSFWVEKEVPLKHKPPSINPKSIS